MYTLTKDVRQYDPNQIKTGKIYLVDIFVRIRIHNKSKVIENVILKYDPINII